MTTVQIRNEDCIKTMQKFIDSNKFVDIILTSPPYSTASAVKAQKSIGTCNNRYDTYCDNMTNEEYCEWSVKLFNMFDKILTKNGVILYNLSYDSENPSLMWLVISDILRNTNFMVADTIIWKKRSALPNNVSKNKLTRITEFVFVICRKSELNTFKANKKVVRYGGSTGTQAYYENVYNFIEAPNNEGTCNLNKATYGSDLFIQLLSIYASENSVIYDPFMGVGTTGLACIKYNNGDNKIVCIGSEISIEQIKYSHKRLESFVFENEISNVNLKTYIPNN